MTIIGVNLAYIIMIKIGIDCSKIEGKDNSIKAGVGRHTYRLLEEISKKNELKETHLFYLYFKDSIPDDIPFLKNEIFVSRVAKLPFFLPFFRPSFNIFFHIAIPLYAKIQRVNVLFFSSSMIPAFCMTKSVVTVFNDMYYEMEKGSLPFKYRLSYSIFVRLAIKRAALITTQTNASRDDLVKYTGLKKENIFVAPLGSDFTQVQNDEKSEKEPFILYLGQAFPRRHLKETILAFDLIASDFPDIRLIASGKDKYNPPVIDELVEKINAKLGSQRIIRKYVEESELEKHYKRATLFIYVSSCEAMGLPPLEALACKTAPIVADTPTTRELFGDNAFFVEHPFSKELIAKTMRNALMDKAKRESIEESGPSIVDEYTWLNHTEKMLEMFNRVASM